MNEANLIQDVLGNGFLLADRWRQQWRWYDALTLVRGLHPVAAAKNNEATANNLLLKARILMSQALFDDQDTLAESEDALNRALIHAQSTDNSSLTGTIWDAKGFVLHAACLTGSQDKEPEDEFTFLESGLRLRKEAKDTCGIAESLFHIGLLHRDIRHEHLQALPYFEEAYDLAQQTNDRTLTSYIVRHIAFAHHDAGNGELAYAAMTESLRLREEIGFAPDIALALHMMAYAEADYGDKSKSIAYLERAKCLFASVGSTKYVKQMAAEIEQFSEV